MQDAAPVVGGRLTRLVLFPQSITAAVIRKKQRIPRTRELVLMGREFQSYDRYEKYFGTFDVRSSVVLQDWWGADLLFESQVSRLKRSWRSDNFFSDLVKCSV